MISCKKQLTKPSPTPFSSKLAQACIRVSILKLRLKELKYGSVHSNGINQLTSSLLESFSIPQTIASTTTMLKAARQNVRQLRKNAVSLCEEFLLSKENDPTNSKIIQRIRRAESLKRVYAKLWFLLRPSQQSLVTHLEVPVMILLPNLLRNGHVSRTPRQSLNDWSNAM